MRNKWVYIGTYIEFRRRMIFMKSIEFIFLIASYHFTINKLLMKSKTFITQVIGLYSSILYLYIN